MEQRYLQTFVQSSATIRPSIGGLGRRFRVGGFAMPYDNFDTAGSGFEYIAFYAPSDANIRVTPRPGYSPTWEHTSDINLAFHLNAQETYMVRSYRYCQLGYDEPA